MIRQLTSHQVGSLNEKLLIEVIGKPGPGGANFIYSITSTERRKPGSPPGVILPIRFQQGDPAEDINGVSNEALLAILEDRLDGFANGPFATEDNASALQCVREAMVFLRQRTVERTARGVEGKQEV